MKLTLVPHPRSAVMPVDITVDVSRTDGALVLTYSLTGDLGALAIPDPDQPDRIDDLWKYSCFEVFFRKLNEHGYLEFNLSPSTRWAAYAFDAYRTGMRDADVAPPAITVTRDTALMLDARIRLPADLADSVLHIGLSAIVEGKDGSKGWFALAHPPGTPDFHHADCFALEVAPSGHP
jgi:hypothetical protein